jgi:hypothetical protein
MDAGLIGGQNVGEDIVEVEGFVSLPSRLVFFLLGHLEPEVVLVVDDRSFFPRALFVQHLVDTEGVRQEEKRGLCGPHLIAYQPDTSF